MVIIFIFFFFSSRRRHTRFDCDWSSDVCSSDLEVKACALGQASSSIMARHVVGSTADELRALRDRMYDMLKNNGPAPTGKWKDLEALTPVRDFKARHASTLLTFDAVVDAINQIEAKGEERKSA